MQDKPLRTGQEGTRAIIEPDMAVISAAAARASLPPACSDRLTIHLLLVDMQVDFCDPAGALYVPGAEGDVTRLTRFIYLQGAHITGITCSLDSHLPHQIFHPSWWADPKGNHPAPFTTICHDDVLKGRWTPLFENEWSVRYTRSLQALGRYELTIWPYHCLLGTPGHGLDPSLMSAILWHSLARGSQPAWWIKGSIPKTEHYSLIQPEIPVPEHPQGRKSQDLFDLLQSVDYLIIAGEAKTHCVLETIEDLVEEFSSRPDILGKVIVLMDCTSPVQHPDIDYETIAKRRFADFRRKGIRSIRSTDPVPW